MERRGASGGGDELTRLINAFYGSVSGQAAPSWRDVDELYAAMRGVVARIRRRRGAAGPDTTDLLHRAWQRVMPFDGARARAAQPRWGAIDSADLNLLLAAFGSSAAGDVDGDDDTDSADLNLLLALFGDACPA